MPIMHYIITVIDIPVILSGKLPRPRPMNDLFREYTGPVLIAQGALDPLNDAKSRAKQFEAIRSGVTVDLMQLGHCPMDEAPIEVGIVCR